MAASAGQNEYKGIQDRYADGDLKDINFEGFLELNESDVDVLCTKSKVSLPDKSKLLLQRKRYREEQLRIEGLRPQQSGIFPLSSLFLSCVFLSFFVLLFLALLLFLFLFPFSWSMNVVSFSFFFIFFFFPSLVIIGDQKKKRTS